AANLRTQLIQATTTAALAQLDLRRLVNLPADRPVKLTTKLEVPTPQRLAQEPADSAALASRAAVAAAERQVSMRQLGVKIARAAYLPSASVRFNYGRFLYPTQPLSWRGQDWKADLTATLSVEVPISG